MPAAAEEIFAEEPTVRVLLVDDDEDDYFITKELLLDCEGADFRLDWIDNFDEARETIPNADYDVYLVDYYLRIGTGLELIDDVREAGAAGPFIVLTGLGDRDIDVRAMRAGASDYLVKGRIDSPLLERSIRYAIERKRANDEREKLIADLQEALNRIKTLSGLLPICSSCKKIRDDSGYWSQVEVYLRDHTDADFTHGLCPECYDNLMDEINAGEVKPKKQSVKETAGISAAAN